MEKCIAIVPPETYQEPIVTEKAIWTSRYNLALWLRVPEVLNSRLRLVLKYEDAKGMHALMVDEVNVARHNVLLSNLVKITASGAIIRMSVFLYSDNAGFDYTVDELFAQRKLIAKHASAKVAFKKS